MAKPLSPHADDGSLDYRAIKRRFLALNRSRLLRIQEGLRARQQVFLDMLPLLFHINHPLLPGYITKDTPSGVYDYQPGKAVLATAKKVAKSFEYKRRALREHKVLALFMMGSTGTIAYTESSDFDIWVCHAPEMSAEELQELREKAAGIERWAAEMDLETHFFLMDAERFRSGEQGKLTKESSGSAQHHMLLDEFYRTGVLIAGRYPAWWLVPPQEEDNYDDYLAMLLHQRFVDAGEIIDFGGIAQVPAGEFVGAALWQLFKGIDSPYKSVLKLLIMELYASSYPSVDLLSLDFKRVIYAGQTELDDLDPYIMMYNKLEAYLREQPERLELARRCFYFKVGIPLSQLYRKEWRAELLESVTRRWGWSKLELSKLDQRRHWKILEVQAERRKLVDELTHSYRMLSGFIREHAQEVNINPADLNVLGRKLYAAFERKPGKVDMVNPGISDDLVENVLTLRQQAQRDGQQIWQLYLGDTSADDNSSQPIRRSSSLIELLAWCHFNQLLGRQTAFSIQVQNSMLDSQELRAIIDALARLFPERRIPDASQESLSQPERAVQAAMFINIGYDPLTKRSLQGLHLTTNRIDALSFGALWENLTYSFDQLIVSSWQEVITARYAGATAVLDSLSKFMAWNPPSRGEKPARMDVFCLSSARGATIARRIEKLYRDVSACYYSGRYPLNTRYIVSLQDHYYILHLENDELQYTKAANHDALLKQLGAPQPEFSPVVIDDYILTDSPLSVIYAANRADCVQFFYMPMRDRVDIYVLDERGSLFHQNLEFRESITLLTQFQWFFDAVLPRRSFLTREESSDGGVTHIELAQITRSQSGDLQLEPRRVPHARKAHSYFSVQVIGDKVGDRPVFTIYCDDVEFSSLEYGDDLFHEVALHIYQRRASGETYPIYLTDIDISKALLGPEAAGGLQTMHYLNHKKRIENRLNQALEAL